MKYASSCRLAGAGGHRLWPRGRACDWGVDADGAAFGLRLGKTQIRHSHTHVECVLCSVYFKKPWTNARGGGGGGRNDAKGNLKNLPMCHGRNLLLVHCKVLQYSKS